MVRATFLPSVGVRSAWIHSDLPDRYFESDLQTPAEVRSSFDSANGSLQSGDILQRYLDSPIRDGMNAWADGELGQFLRDPANQPSGPLVPQSDLENLLSFLQSQQGRSQADPEDVADAIRAGYLEATLGDTPTAYSAGANASWMLFGGFSRMFRRSAAIHGKQQTLASKLDAERLLRGGVATSTTLSPPARGSFS